MLKMYYIVELVLILKDLNNDFYYKYFKSSSLKYI